MNLLFPLRTIAIAMRAAMIMIWFASASVAHEEYACDPGVVCVTDDSGEGAPSWIFSRGTYTHDPYTGARVAQYMRTPPVEPLDDERMVTSRYRRSRTNLRGHDGSVDTYYEVQAWGNGRGGIDAEWERFHDAWKESYLTGGFYNQGGQGQWGAGHGFHGGFGSGFGFGFPGSGFPSFGHGGPWHEQSPSGGHHGHHGGDHHFGGHHGGNGHYGGNGQHGGDHHGGNGHHGGPNGHDDHDD